MPKPDYTALTFPEPPAGRPYVVANMVASVDGRATVEGNEQGLGSSVDQRLMRELRVHADVVLNGAGTLRASGTSSRLGDPLLDQLRASRGQARPPLAAVVTRSGDVPLDRAFFTARDFDAVVYVSEAAAAARRDAIAATGRTVVTYPEQGSVAWILGHLRSTFGAELVVCEGGPSLNGLLLAEDCLDELFLTLGPVLAGGPDPLTIVATTEPRTRAGLRRLRLVHAVPDEGSGEVYLRYRLERGPTHTV